MSAQVIAILSNKGGVGKTHLATNLALSLAEQGRRVLIVDADWSSASVARKLGIHPQRTFRDYLRDGGELRDLVLPTTLHPNLRILAGTVGDFDVANLESGAADRLLRAIEELAEIAKNYVVLYDLGAGVEARTLDLALAADRPLIVTTPQDVLSGYGCLKALLYRYLYLLADPPAWFHVDAFHPLVIVNQVLEAGMGTRVVSTMQNLLREYMAERVSGQPELVEDYLEAVDVTGTVLRQFVSNLSPTNQLAALVSLQLLGEVPYAREFFIKAEMDQKPFLYAEPNHPAAQAIRRCAVELQRTLDPTAATRIPRTMVGRPHPRVSIIDAVPSPSLVPPPVRRQGTLWDRLASYVRT